MKDTLTKAGAVFTLLALFGAVAYVTSPRAERAPRDPRSPVIPTPTPQPARVRVGRQY